MLKFLNRGKNEVEWVMDTMELVEYDRIPVSPGVEVGETQKLARAGPLNPEVDLFIVGIA